MATISVKEPDGQSASYQLEKARELWDQGAISPDATYWNVGMPDWRPIRELFEPGWKAPAAKTRNTASSPPASLHLFEDSSKRTRFLKFMLVVYCIFTVMGAVGSFVDLQTGESAALAQMDPAEVTEPMMKELAFKGLMMMMIFGFAHIIGVFVTGITFLRWISQANRNARALGAQGMTFTPGWSIGWYFVPVLALWKPRQAMKQIWQASKTPENWAAEKAPSLLSWWWGLWLLSNSLGQLYTKLLIRSAAPNTKVTEVQLFAVEAVSAAVDVVLCFVAIKLVTSIYELQRERLQAFAK